MVVHQNRILFIYIPHILAESEERRVHPGGSKVSTSAKIQKDIVIPHSLIIASGKTLRSTVVDYSPCLEGKGVRKGMLLKNIPSLLKNTPILLPDYIHLEEINRKLLTMLNNYSPVVENSSAGEYFLDLTGTGKLLGRQIDTSIKIMFQLKQEWGFSACCGIGNNILVARLSALVAGYGGALEVPEGSERLFLAPLSPALLPDISPAIKKELIFNFNLRSLKDVASLPCKELSTIFGKDGELLHLYSCGMGRQKLFEKKTHKCIKGEKSLRITANSGPLLRKTLFSLLVELCTGMREQGSAPKRFCLEIIYVDGYRKSFRGRIVPPSFFEKELYNILLPYTEKAVERRVGIKKLYLEFTGFSTPSIQPELFHDELKTARLTGAFDCIKKRFGEKAIYYGNIFSGETFSEENEKKRKELQNHSYMI